jgi:hypothetical protein
MGKFDRMLEGEKKPRGVKRKVRTNMVLSFERPRS